ncbi:MAG TPA: antibiotic biosynthesis monooxygenase [Puia sp.]|jgi:quinol monooxygenase YgiN
MKYGAKVIFIIFSLITSNHLMSQSNSSRYMRLARIVVDSAQLENYRAALKEGMSTAVKGEPGVISLSAVYEKERPTHVTVFEIYTDENAYKAHIQTAHFLKYKTAVHGMVKSLELVDVSPIAMETK